ncbi:MAG: hypothetical protein JXP48_14600 [Acidobacteria bacterium]|nr:hypothetical protein [Acidobacteriota bacterium]
MKNNSSDSATGPGKRRRGVGGRGVLIPGVLILAAAAVLAAVYFHRAPEGSASRGDTPPPEFTEIVAASGTVQILETGDSEWRAAGVGQKLADGDLVRTGARGGASIRYPNGTVASIRAGTIFAVQPTGSNEMEIWMTASPGPAERAGGEEAGPGGGRRSLDRAEAGGLIPSLRLERIVPFGQSLELVGHVEPGSRLTVNGEKVVVEGDGAFKHFTNPFPKTAETVEIVLKATNLAGRTSTLTAEHHFRNRAGDR